MKLTEVKSPTSAKEFIDVNVLLNKHDLNYIRPLDKDINQVFDKDKNKTFRLGELKRWILKDDNERLIGRIAAFTNKKYKNKGDQQPTGGIGFFDCINDQKAANILFDTAKEWLQNNGMEAMDGPINFGERDRWWGLVVEGFTPPLYCMNYNPPYYQQLFENYGFCNFYNQICWQRSVVGKLEEKFYTAHARFANNLDYSVQRVRKNNLDKYAVDFATVYNKAWASHEGNKEMSSPQAIKLFRSMKPIMDEDLAWITYYRGEPIAIYINIPDINQIIKHLNGKFDLINKLKFLWLKRKGICTRFTGIIFGVVPRFQGKGIDYYMIVEAAKIIQPKEQYKEIELQWQGDFNPKMLNISRNLDFTQSRRLVTYRYLFDRTKEFKRHPILN